MASAAELSEFARALAAASAPPEYCLFYWHWACMPRTDWAAWVGSLGTVLAIAVAFWIGRRDAKDRARDRKNSQLERLRIGKQAVSYVLHLIKEHQAHIDALKPGDRLPIGPDNVNDGAALLRHAIELQMEANALYPLVNTQNALRPYVALFSNHEKGPVTAMGLRSFQGEWGQAQIKAVTRAYNLLENLIAFAEKGISYRVALSSSPDHPGHTEAKPEQ